MNELMQAELVEAEEYQVHVEGVLAKRVEHDEPCFYTIKATPTEIIDHFMRLLDDEAERELCK